MVARTESSSRRWRTCLDPTLDLVARASVAKLELHELRACRRRFEQREPTEGRPRRSTGTAKGLEALYEERRKLLRPH